MKTLKKTLCLVLAVVMAVGVLVLPANAATEFTDDADITHDEAVAVLSGLGIVNGVGDGSFNPDGTFTRAQAAALLANVLLTPDYAAILDSSKAVFSDVPVTNGYNKYITWAVEQGHIHGYPDGTFKPNKELTGTELAALMLEALGEEIDGANYKNFVNTTAKKYKLTDGITGYVASSVISRDDAVQMMFNTMKKATGTKTVYKVYKNGVDEGTYQAASEDNALLVAANLNALSAVANSGDNYTVKPITTDEGSILATIYKASNTDVESDSFKRPMNVWLDSDGDVLYAAATEPVLEYTTPVSYGKIYADLGLTKTTDVSVYIDGTVRTTETNELRANKVEQVGVSNYGVLTQVYENGRNTLGRMTYKVTQICPYYANVDDVKDVKEVTTAVTTRTAYFKIFDNHNWFGDDDRTTTDKDLVNFAKNDKVILTQSQKESGGSWTVQSAYKLDTITGTLSKIVGRLDSVLNTYVNHYTINGKEYVACDAQTLGDLSNSVGSELTFRVDEYGYLVDVVNPANSDPDYILVLAAQGRTNDTWGIANPTAQVYGILSDGTYGYYTVNYANASGSGFLNAAPDLGTESSYAPQIFQYITNAKGELLLRVTSGTSDDREGAVIPCTISNGATSLTFDTSKTAVLNNQTLFIYYTADPSTKLVKTFATRVGNAYCGNITFAASGTTGYVGLKYSSADPSTTATAAKVVFVNTDYSEVISTSGYAYIKDAYDYVTTELAADGTHAPVYHYTAYKSDGTTEDVIKKGTALATGAGLYKINTGNVIGDKLSADANPVTGYTVKTGEVTEQFVDTLQVNEGGATKVYRGYTDGTYTFCGTKTGIKRNHYWGIVDSTGNFTAIWFYDNN